jgi:hypothetical protein
VVPHLPALKMGHSRPMECVMIAAMMRGCESCVLEASNADACQKRLSATRVDRIL